MTAMPGPCSSGERRVVRAAALFAALASGGAVLSLELLAAGWLAPVFGAGLDVWATVLAVTFGAMAAGYLLGSLRTGVWATPARAAGLAAGGAILVLAGTEAGRRAVGAAGALASNDAPELLGCAALLLAPPIVALAWLGPWLVEIHHWASGTGTAGRSAGLTYAASTLGGVGCALAAGFHAIPVWGLWGSALGVAALLSAATLVLAGAAVGAGRVRGAGLASLAALLAVGIGVGRGSDGAAGGREVLEAAVGPRGHYLVTDDGIHRTLYVNGIPQTRVPRYPSPFSRVGELLAAGNALEMLPWLRPEATSALLVGLGGGSLADFLAGEYGWTVEAVELDPTVVRLARQHFGYRGTCHVLDARRFLVRDPRRYDAIVLDVYRGEDIPTHLVTREFFALVRKRLREDGLLAMNVIGRATAPDAGALIRTLGEVFDHLALYAPAGERLAPMTLVASPTRAIEDPSTADRLAEAGLQPARRADLDALPLGRAPVLTDDRNPMSLLRRPTARAWRAAALRLHRSRESSP